MYGRNIANWMYSHFGLAEAKRIPKWIWDAPEEFAIGLLEGWLCGDGSVDAYSKKRGGGSVVGVGKLSRIVFTMREISFALGLGGIGLLFENKPPRRRLFSNGCWGIESGVRFDLVFSGPCFYRLGKLLNWKLGKKELWGYFGREKAAGS